MSIGQAIAAFRKEKDLTQEELARMLPIDRTVLTRIEGGQKELPSGLEPVVSGVSWKVAIEIADIRTGGFISNILNDVPNLDLHPAALKDVLLKELQEAGKALEALVMAKHIDPEKRRASAENVWHEIRDVVEKATVLQGVLEDEFALDRKKLIQQHEYQIKKGER